MVNLSKHIRNWVMNKVRIPIIKNYIGESVYVFKKTNNYKTCKWINKYINGINNKNQIQNNIILTWTNRMCNLYNQIIRKKFLEEKIFLNMN